MNITIEKIEERDEFKKKYQKQPITKSETVKYNKSYYEINKDKWKTYNAKRQNMFYNCDICKCSVGITQYKTHLTTKKHLKHLSDAQLSNEPTLNVIEQ
jgi:hypothetical protein